MYIILKFLGGNAVRKVSLMDFKQLFQPQASCWLTLPSLSFSYLVCEGVQLHRKGYPSYLRQRVSKCMRKSLTYAPLRGKSCVM